MEPIAVSQKRLAVLIGEGPDIHAFRDRAPDDLVVHIRNIHHLIKFPTFTLQVTPQDISGNEGPKVPDVYEIVDRRTADVHADRLTVTGLELFQLSGQRVREFQHDE